MEVSQDATPFERYQKEHLMYCPAQILEDPEFNKHAEQLIENVCF